MKRAFSIGAAFLVSFAPMVALAACQSGGGSPTDGLINPTCYQTLDEFLAGVLHAAVLIVFPIIVLAFVYIGWLFVFNGNNPEGLKKAREYFIYAVIGALIVLGAEALSRAIGATVTAISGN
jgi:Na+-driven multidrug efflux pump